MVLNKCRFAILFLILVGCTSFQSDKLPRAVSVPNAKLAKFALLSDQIHDVAADKNSIWIATDKGVNRLIKSENRWTSYTVEDGLVNNRHLSKISIYLA